MIDLDLTLHSLTNNPLGKGSAYAAARYAIKNDLDVRYALIIKDVKQFKTKLYAGKGFTVFYFQVPSEQLIPGLFYDVVFEFTHGSNTQPSDIMKTPLKVFSNNPAFAFTYAYVCYTNDLIPTYLHNKLSIESKKQPPVIRNKFEQLGFEKSLYFASKYLIDNGYINLASLPVAAFNKFSENTLSNQIMNFEKKLKEVYAFKKEAAEDKDDLIDEEDVKKNKHLAKQKMVYSSKIRPVKKISAIKPIKKR